MEKENVRFIPAHGYTPGTISWKMFRENTSVIALLLGIVLPTTNKVNSKLSEMVNDPHADAEIKDIICVFRKSGEEAGIAYSERLARVGCQTALASYLCSRASPFADSVVYVWDVYPRLERLYASELLRFLRIPVFLASFVGYSPTDVDIKFIKQPTSVISGMEDVAKRHSVIVFGDIIVDAAKIALKNGNSKESDKVELVINSVTARLTTAASATIGAGLGRAIAGDRGQYWGEIVALLCAPFAVARITSKIHKLRRESKHSSKSHKQRKSTESHSSSQKIKAR